MKKKSRQGFASMTPEKRREIASMGGKAAHASGNAHKWTPETAAVAGSIGGRAAALKNSLKIKVESL